MNESPVAMDVTDVDAFVTGRHHEMFEWLRAHDPVHWHAAPDRRGFWALTRYADVLAAYVDHATFSSSGGAVLGGSFRSQADTAAGHMLVASDPPRHRLLRQQMHRLFGPAVIRRVTAQVATLVDRAIKRARADGGCDFATDVATELPVGALMTMVGIPYDLARHLIGLTRKMVGFRDPAVVGTDDDERLRLAAIQLEIIEFFAELVRERRRNPGDDLVGVLLTAEVNGRPLSEEEVLYNCMNVAVGGNETTPHTACSGMLALLGHPEQHALLARRPDLRDSAVNEILRWSSVNAYVQRIATRDVEIRGRQVRAGDSVTLWNISANRDEEQFPASHRFDITRSPNRHLAYGAGIHRCIGMPTGQAELTVLFDRLLASGIGFAPAGAPQRLRSNFILGVTSLPLSVTA